MAKGTNRGRTEAIASAKSPGMESAKVINSCCERLILAFVLDAMSDMLLASLLMWRNDKLPNIAVELERILCSLQDNSRATR